MSNQPLFNKCLTYIYIYINTYPCNAVDPDAFPSRNLQDTKIFIMQSLKKKSTIYLFNTCSIITYIFTLAIFVLQRYLKSKFLCSSILDFHRRKHTASFAYAYILNLFLSRELEGLIRQTINLKLNFNYFTTIYKQVLQSLY